MKCERHESIEKTRICFEESFEAGSLYNRQTQDQEHLELILDSLKINTGMKILDLGTGTGYLAFPIAEKYPDAEVIGLDIVENALNRNREKAEVLNLKNLHFKSYDGLEFPFADHVFDLVITRYALHHFPTIRDTFQEIGRVLKPNGIFFLADPAPNDDDTERFVDAYMQMKNDGHIKFYTKKEWLTLGTSAGFELVDGFETHIRFPRKKQTASSTQMEIIERVLRENEIFDYFEVIVTGAMFKRSKPDPEIYHDTAQKLGTAESECFVIEDSTYGVTAAKRAGMTVAALIDERYGFDQSLADFRVHSLREVFDLL